MLEHMVVSLLTLAIGMCIQSAITKKDFVSAALLFVAITFCLIVLKL